MGAAAARITAEDFVTPPEYAGLIQQYYINIARAKGAGGGSAPAPSGPPQK